MNWKPPAMVRRVRSVPAHLADLSSYLRDLSSQVKASVAEAVGTTVSGLVRDGLHRLWQADAVHLPPPHSSPSSRQANAYRWEEDLDVWDTEPMSREYASPPSRPFSSSSPGSVPSPSPTVDRSGWSLTLGAAALRAAGWWLQRRGSRLGALAVGLGISALALLGGPAVVVGLGVVEAASELLALNALLSQGSALVAGA